MWGVEETFRRAVDWYRAYFDRNVDMQRFGLDQIQAYEAVFRDEPCTMRSGGRVDFSKSKELQKKSVVA